MTLDYKSRLMRLHANSLELRRLRYDIIYTYKVVFGLVNGAAFDLFTLTSLVYSSGTRGHTYKLFPHCSRVDLYKYFFSHYNKQIKQPTYRTAWASLGLLVLSEAQTYHNFYRSDTNRSRF